MAIIEPAWTGATDQAHLWDGDGSAQSQGGGFE
jgi:hypothetical protein